MLLLGLKLKYDAARPGAGLKRTLGHGDPAWGLLRSIRAPSKMTLGWGGRTPTLIPACSPWPPALTCKPALALQQFCSLRQLKSGLYGSLSSAADILGTRPALPRQGWVQHAGVCSFQHRLEGVMGGGCTPGLVQKHI